MSAATASGRCVSKQQSSDSICMTCAFFSLQQIFRRNYFEGVERSAVELRMEQTNRELAELERRFLEKVAETNMKMCTKCESLHCLPFTANGIIHAKLSIS